MDATTMDGNTCPGAVPLPKKHYPRRPVRKSRGRRSRKRYRRRSRKQRKRSRKRRGLRRTFRMKCEGRSPPLVFSLRVMTDLLRSLVGDGMTGPAASLTSRGTSFPPMWNGALESLGTQLVEYRKLWSDNKDVKKETAAGGRAVASQLALRTYMYFNGPQLPAPAHSANMSWTVKGVKARMQPFAIYLSDGTYAPYACRTVAPGSWLANLEHKGRLQEEWNEALDELPDSTELHDCLDRGSRLSAPPDASLQNIYHITYSWSDMTCGPGRSSLRYGTPTAGVPNEKRWELLNQLMTRAFGDGEAIVVSLLEVTGVPSENWMGRLLAFFGRQDENKNARSEESYFENKDRRAWVSIPCNFNELHSTSLSELEKKIGNASPKIKALFQELIEVSRGKEKHGAEMFFWIAYLCCKHKVNLAYHCKSGKDRTGFMAALDHSAVVAWKQQRANPRISPKTVDQCLWPSYLIGGVSSGFCGLKWGGCTDQSPTCLPNRCIKKVLGPEGLGPWLGASSSEYFK